MLKEVGRAVRLIPKNVVYFARQIGDFDRLHGTDTGGHVGPDGLGAKSDYVEFGYEATPVRFFRRAMQMGSIPIEGSTFIDIGAGQGRTLLLASHFPFRRVIGVELSPMLAGIARHNLEVYRSVRQRCRDLQVICADALEYRWPEEPLVLYMYNPFSASVMERLLENVRKSIATTPRPASIVYFNPVQRDVLDRLPWLDRVTYRQFNSRISRRPMCRIAIYAARLSSVKGRLDEPGVSPT